MRRGGTHGVARTRDILVLVTHMTSRNGLPKVRTLSPSEGFALLDRRARAELGVSGRTFIERWKAGRYAKRATRPEVMRVAMLLPFAR